MKSTKKYQGLEPIKKFLELDPIWQKPIIESVSILPFADFLPFIDSIKKLQEIFKTCLMVKGKNLDPDRKIQVLVEQVWKRINQDKETKKIFLEHIRSENRESYNLWARVDNEMFFQKNFANILNYKILNTTRLLFSKRLGNISRLIGDHCLTDEIDKFERMVVERYCGQVAAPYYEWPMAGEKIFDIDEDGIEGECKYLASDSMVVSINIHYFFPPIALPMNILIWIDRLVKWLGEDNINYLDIYSDYWKFCLCIPLSGNVAKYAQNNGTVNDHYNKVIIRQLKEKLKENGIQRLIPE